MMSWWSATAIKAFKSFVIISVIFLIILMIMFASVNPGNNQPRLNEVLLNPWSIGFDTQYVEIYNPGEKTIYLNGWHIESGKEKISLYGELEPGKYLLVFGELSLEHKEINLRNNIGMQVDTFKYDPDDMGSVASRIPDGVGAWKWVENPTPGQPNTID
jgi:hypothetical protein